MEKNNYFLGSVGRVDAFAMVNGHPVLAFVSKTMTDQGLNTSISADDIRAGQGAPVITRFYHDVNVDITLTDVMFKEAYVEAQLGTHFEAAGEMYYSEEVTSADTGNKFELSETPLTIDFGCGASEVVVWYSKKGSNEWRLATSADGKISDKEVTDTEGIENNTDYCVRYLREGISGAKKAAIYASFVPTELHLIITTPLYAGDACSASSGSVAGEVQFDIPRFRPNGGQDFAASMSANQTTNLSGVALGSSAGCEENGALLYTMTVVYNSQTLASQYESLEVLDESLKVGAMPMVYGIDSAKRATLIANSLLTFTPALADGKFATAGETTIAAADNSGLTETVTVAA